MTLEEQQNIVAEQVCGKCSELSFSKCLEERRMGNSPCTTYGKCRIEEKSQSQLEYVLSDRTKNVFLKACPGSGKTEVVALKTAYEMRSWNRFPGGIAVLTFTNNAADVISERVSQCVGEDKISFRAFIGTFDSWLHGYIGHPFFHHLSNYDGRDGDKSIRVIDFNSQSGFLNAFSTKYGFNQSGHPQANQYYADLEKSLYRFSSGNRALDAGRNTLELEEYQITDLKNTKIKFHKSGFATYQDVENICYHLLSDINLCRRLSKRFPFIVVDECQDLSWVQMQILKLLIDAGSFVHFVGDLDQAIYEFKEVLPDKIASFVADNGFVEMPLLDNYRSVQPIVDLCQELVGGSAVNGLSCDDIPRCLYFTYEPNELADVVTRYEQLLIDRGLGCAGAVVLARGNNTVSKLRPSANRNIDKPQLYLSISIYLWKFGGAQALEDSLLLLGRFITLTFFRNESAHSRNYYCPESVKSNLQWRLFLAATLTTCMSIDSGALLDFSQTWTQWARAVRANLHLALNENRGALDNVRKDFPLLGSSDFRALHGRSNEPVIESVCCASAVVSSLSIKTIHGVKGETYDSVLLVSAPTAAGNAGGNWKEWLKDPKSEYARFAYVGSSRPRELLVWAVPVLTAEEVAQIEELGFKSLDDDDSDEETNIFNL